MHHLCKWGGLGVAMAAIVAMVSLLIVPVVDHRPESAVHPTIDQLRLRTGIPTRLSDDNVVRLVRRSETFRILDRAYGVSEKPLVQREWYEVENTATRERGFVASWYTEIAPTDLYDATKTFSRPFGQDLWVRTLRGWPVLVATARYIFRTYAGSALDAFAKFATIVAAITALIAFRHSRAGRASGNHSGVLRADLRPVPPPRRSIEDRQQGPAPMGRRRRYYGVAAGKAWTAPRPA